MHMADITFYLDIYSLNADMQSHAIGEQLSWRERHVDMCTKSKTNKTDTPKRQRVAL